MKKPIFLLMVALCFLQFNTVEAQNSSENGVANTNVNVFLDADFIDASFLREEFPQVNYVRTRDAANVHLLGTSQSTGAGRQYEFYFIGLDEFAGDSDTLSYFSSGQSTDTEVREGYTKVIKIGLLPFMVLSNQYPDLVIGGGDSPKGGDVVEEDKWDSWVFEAQLMGDMEGEESSDSKTLEGMLQVNRTTPEWRYDFFMKSETRERNFDFGDISITDKTIERRAKAQIVNSLGDHFAIGLEGGVVRDTRENFDLNYIVSPEIEYNFYPYDMSSRRQLRLAYYIGLDGRNYAEETIFDKTEEQLTFQKIALGYRSKEQWGEISTTITFQHFLRNFEENYLGINAGLDIRIWKGLSWNLSGSYSIINDDINISKSEVSQDDLLLGSRQLATSESYSVRMGLSFTFGSLYNNVVNIRLEDMERRGGGGPPGGY